MEDEVYLDSTGNPALVPVVLEGSQDSVNQQEKKALWQGN